jgi:hypothetical protein
MPINDNITGGPAAPKDAEKKREFFYILQNKDIIAAPQPDGSLAHFLYMDMGRVLDAARLTGNVTDAAMIENLSTAAGIKKMIHSIGISVSAKETDQKARFMFEMYPNHPGEDATILEADVPMDGMEVVIDLTGVDFKETDRELGQIRYVFDTEGIQATTDVRFYLNDGFTAPVQLEESAVDFASDNYRNMIARSLMQTGNKARLGRVIEKARRGEDVTLGFVGGSITQGAGAIPINEKCYARVFYEDFVKRYMKGGECRFVKAGVGGTPSELGMLRFERDVLRDGTEEPDLIVIEFAVNDEGDETQGVCYESLVRMALSKPWKPAVILLFSVFSNDWNLQDRLSPVGKRYDLPMVSVLDAVSPQFPLLPSEGRVISKNQYFYDVFHPSNLGHQIMADCLSHLVDVAGEADLTAAVDDLDVVSIEPVIGADFEHVQLLDKKEMERLTGPFSIQSVEEGSFAGEDTDLQCVELDKSLEQTPQFPYNWCHLDGSEPFRMTLTCSKLLVIFKDSASAIHGTAEILVDGKFVRDADPHVNNWTHCNPVIVLNDKEPARHELTIAMKSGHEDRKFTILGFGVV